MDRNGARKKAPGRGVPTTGKAASFPVSVSAEERERERRRKYRALQRERRARAVRRERIGLAVGILVGLFVLIAGIQLVPRAYANSKLAEEVLAYRETVEKYALKAGVSDYTDTLLAIMMVESEGQGKDVMQASESLGLEPGSLEPEASIEQACIYFAALVGIEQDLGIEDDSALIQAYNFGPGYLFYLAENGKKHKQRLAIEYAREQSGGKKIRYLHLYAIKKNGGWIYRFGNMFYETLVQQYL